MLSMDTHGHRTDTDVAQANHGLLSQKRNKSINQPYQPTVSMRAHAIGKHFDHILCYDAMMCFMGHVVGFRVYLTCSNISKIQINRLHDS